MKTRLLWAQVLAVVLLTATSVGAAAPATARKVPVTDNAQALADLIDQQIERRLTKVDVKPVALADDSEFLRRTYLDLAGRIPTVEESRSFLNDNRGDRRARLIEQLLTSPRYTAHFTNVWRALLIPEASNNFQIRLQQGTFEGWIRTRLAKNVGYDRIVRDLITAPVSSSGFSPASLTGQGPPSSLPFYIAKELKAENLAAGTARVFLGVSVECAQCHNHPFANWTREQFWSFAAFFSGIKSQRAQDFILPGSEEPNKRSIPMPGTGKVVQARFLDGHDPLWRPGVNTRTILAEWLTAPTNPYFARATVNRMWSYFLGTGLVEPVDEMAGTSANASHPELLDLLAHEFVTHDFDLKYIIRAITLSKTYQRSSAGPLSPSMESSLFARMPPRLDAGATLRQRGAGDGFPRLRHRREPADRPVRRQALGPIGVPHQVRFVGKANRVADVDLAGADADERQGHRRRDLPGEERNAGRGCGFPLRQHCRACRNAVPGHRIAEADGAGNRARCGIRGGRRQTRRRSRREEPGGGLQ